MAKRKRRRLTNRMQNGCAYVQSETGKEGVGHYTTQRRLPELITFTCKVEDIMEKYHCNDIGELEKKLADCDTWQKACELACETLKQVMGKPLWIGGNIPAPEVKDTEYFYQQAKKEGNDERKN